MTNLPKIVRGPAGLITTVPAGGDALRVLLSAYESAAASAGSPTALLRPGLDSEWIRSEFATVGLPASDEILAWYEWHDGANVDRGRPWASDPISFVRPASLAEVIDEYRRSEGDGYGWVWAPGWIRLGRELTSLAINLIDDDSRPARVVEPDEEFMLDEFPRDTIAVGSLGAVVAVHLDAIQRHLLEWRNESWLVDPSVENPWRAERGLI